MHSISSFQRSNPSLTKILEALDQGVAVFDADKKLVYLNSAMTNVTGGEGEIGGALQDLAVSHALRDEQGNEVPLERFPINRAFSGEEIHDVRFEYIHTSGKSTWLSVSCRVIRDEAGAIEYVYTLIRNISRRKSNEDRLRFLLESTKILAITAEFRARLREKARLTVPVLADWCAIDILNDKEKVERVAFVHADPDIVNDMLRVLEKYPEDQESPGSMWSIITKQKPVLLSDYASDLMKRPHGPQEYVDMLQRLGTRSLLVVPIVSRGKGLGAMTLAHAHSGRIFRKDDLDFFQEYCNHLGVLLDNARLYDELRERDKAKDIFLAALSHELRNPLAPIKSSLDLIRIKGNTGNVQEEMSMIEHNFDHMAKLLNDLLDVTRFTKGAITLSRAVVDLEAIVQRAVTTIQSLLRDSGVALSVEYPQEPILVFGDETRIEQAVLNVLSNAAKFTSSGGQISVHVSHEDESASITIRDTGIGISEADLPKIFDMYYRAEHSKSSSGLGVGLLLVQQILRLHEGTVLAKSDGVGTGSEFILTIPKAERAVAVRELVAA